MADRYTLQQVLEKFSDAHGERYDYSLVTEYSGAFEPVQVVCSEHGEFTQSARSHWQGMGCWACSRTNPSRLFPLSKVLDRFQKVHGDRYNYDLVDYTTCHVPVRIICLNHGEFSQRPSAHWKGQNCPSCREMKYTSEPEKLWYNALKAHTGWEIDRNVYLKGRGSVDMVAEDTPFGPVALEYDGQYWHAREGSYDRDTKKVLTLTEIGYTVVRLRETGHKFHPELPAIDGAINIWVPPTPTGFYIETVINQLQDRKTHVLN